MPTPRRQHPTIAAKIVGEWDDDIRVQEFLRIQEDYECTDLRPKREAIAEVIVKSWTPETLIANYLSLRQDYESALEASRCGQGARIRAVRAGQRLRASTTSRSKKRRRTQEGPPCHSMDEATAEDVHVAAEFSSVREELLKTRRTLDEVQLEADKLQAQSDQWENEAREARVEISELIQRYQTEARSSTTTIQEHNATIASLGAQVHTLANELDEKKKHCSELYRTQNTLKETLLTAESLRAELARSQSVANLAKTKVARENEKLRSELSTSTRLCKEKEGLVESLKAQLVSRDKRVAVQTQLCSDLQQMLWQQDFRGSNSDNAWLPA
jgi:chromosome segregation ATPase